MSQHESFEQQLNSITTIEDHTCAESVVMSFEIERYRAAVACLVDDNETNRAAYQQAVAHSSRTLATYTPQNPALFELKRFAFLLDELERVGVPTDILEAFETLSTEQNNSV